MQEQRDLDRHGFLTGLHDALAPRSYLEIGINDGRGLARSRTRTIGVDPDYKIKVELACDLKLVKATSDDFFARPEAIDWFPEGVIDFAFIDGMHLFEFALRDFINTELLCTPGSVVVLDDMLPRSIREAARNRNTVDWAGDVYKVAQVLERFRPDLAVVSIDSQPTGVTLVVGLDPANTTLQDNYDAILAEYLTPDPQDVGDEILHRRNAADPERVIASGVWDALIAARTAPSTPAEVVERLTALRGSASFTLVPPADKPYPPTRKTGQPPRPTAPSQPPSTGQRVKRKIKRLLA
jgi:hypothetical protein